MRFLSGLTGIALHALWLFAFCANFLKVSFFKKKGKKWNEAGVEKCS